MIKTKPEMHKIQPHYGIWPEDGSCRHLEEGQANLLQLLMEDFPPAPARILVAGVRLGFSVSTIARRGYELTVVDPSAELIRHTTAGNDGSDVDFRVSDFMVDDSLEEEGYDLLLLLEVASWVESLDELMNRARRFLNDSGSIIMTSEMSYSRSFARDINVKTPADFIVSLSENGFFITRRENITNRASGTPDSWINLITERNEKSSPSGMDLGSKEKNLSSLDYWEKRKQWFESHLLDYEIISAKKSTFFMRAYVHGDEDQILEMFEQTFHTPRSIDHWNWKYKENPFGSLKIALAVDEEGTLAAHYAGYPVPFCFIKDKASLPMDFLAYQNGDTMTRQKFRNVGLGKSSLLARVFYYFIAKFSEDSLSFYYGFNTDKIKILGQRYLGYNYIQPVILRERDLNAMPLKDPGRFKRMKRRYSVEEVREVDAEWDDFFDRVSPSYEFLVRRNSKYIRWRYLECPDEVHSVFAVRKGRRLVGWGVFSRKGEKLIWGDALFEKKIGDALDLFLSEVVKSAYPGIESIEAWFQPHPEWWDRALERSGFSRRAEPRGLTPCAQHNPYSDRKGPSVVELEKDRFYYTMGDSDLF